MENCLKIAEMAGYTPTTDLKSFRVKVRFEDKEGTMVCGDILRGHFPILDKKGHPTGKLAEESYCYADLDYAAPDEHGQPLHWRYTKLNGRENPQPYTIQGLLNFVNRVSKVQYTSVEFVERNEI